MPQKPDNKNQPSTPPAYEIRLNGIQATIWANSSPQGPRYNTVFKRYYREEEEWKTSESFGRDDLLTLSFVAQEALRWIMAQKPKQTPAVAH